MRIEEDKLLELLIINEEYIIHEIVELVYKKYLKVTSPEYVYILKTMAKIYKKDLVKKRFDGRYIYYTRIK